jgi:hypothetical protein
MRADGETVRRADMTKGIAAFLNLANATENRIIQTYRPTHGTVSSRPAGLYG